MTTKLVRVGNSRGVRLPRQLLELYAMSEGDDLVLEETRDGILLRPAERGPGKLSWSDAYREMAAEAAERAEWAAWDGLSGDGLDAPDD
jgi:antitoxin MazE